VGAGASLFPVWLSRSFRLEPEVCPEADDAGPSPAPRTAPAAAYCDPPTAGVTKPLLVLVIPASDDRAQWDRGHAFGELINHGSDEQLALLALFDVVCRKVEDLSPDVRARVRGEPLMLVVEHRADDVAVDVLTADLPPHLDADGRGFPHGLDGDRDALEDRRIRERIAVVAGLLDTHVAARLADQAARERAALDCDDRTRLDDPSQLTPEFVDRAAAGALLAARARPGAAREHLLALLAAAARARLSDRPIPGAPWARGGGCGVFVEGADEQHGFACGMGHVPRLSVRFLKFYSRNW
jgi:hypothetical protein